MRKGRIGKIAWFGLITVLLMALLLPVTMVFAEIPGDSAVIELDAGYVLGDTYQRHSFYSDGRHWVFWANDSQILYTSSDDLLNWETPAEFSDYLCELGEGCCNGSSFSLFYDEGMDRVDIAYSNVSAANTALYYQRGRPETTGSITWGNVQIALEATANMTYSHPSVCVDTDDFPYIAVMVYNATSSDYEGWLTTSNDSTGIWTAATNSTLNLFTITASDNEIYYPSVVPVSNGNVSAQYVLVSAGDFIMGQNILEYNVVTDTWTDGGAQYPLPATSVLKPDEIWRHSEVAYASVNNSDDVYLVCKVNDSVIGEGLLYDRLGDPASPWASDDMLEEADIIATLSVRNALGNLVLTAINTSDLASIYSADYTQATLSWNTITSVRPTNAEGAYIMSSYDHSNSSYVDYLWLDNGAPFDLALGCYGCTISPAPAAASTDPGTTVMQIIIPLLVAITVVVLALKGIGEVNTVNAIVILMIATLIGVITFFVIKQLVLGI